MDPEAFEALLARIDEIRTEVDDLAERDELTDDEETRWTEINAEFDDLNTKRERYIKRQKDVAAIREAAADPRNVVRGVAAEQELADEPFSSEARQSSVAERVFDLNTIDQERGMSLRSRALTSLEVAKGYTNRDREILTGWLEATEDSTAGSALARHMIVTGSPEYGRAFMRALRTLLDYGAADPSAIGTLQNLQPYTYERAMSLTDTAGGFAIPQQLDPALILTSDGSVNSIRQVARVVQATGDVWSGLSTTHAAWSNDTEAEEVSDDTTTYAQPTVAIHKQQVFIPFSVEIQGDYPGLEADLRTIIGEGKDDLDATNFTTGSGTNQPFGIVTALTGTGSEISSITVDTFAIADVFAIDEALPVKYRRRATWHGHRAVANAIRQFDTTGGAALWERMQGDVPANLLGKPWFENEAMDSTPETAAADNRILIFGDFRNYVIADRVGATLELVPHLFDTTTNRPSGQRGLFGWARGGADSVNDGAFRMLNVT